MFPLTIFSFLENISHMPALSGSVIFTVKFHAAGFSFTSKSMALLSEALIFFCFFLSGISESLECHVRVLSAHLAAKQSHEVKECVLLLQSSLKRIGKQVPARPLTLLLCGGVRLRRRHSRIKLLRVGSLATDMRHCTLLDSLAECSICMEMSHNHHNMCSISCIL